MSYTKFLKNFTKTSPFAMQHLSFVFPSSCATHFHSMFHRHEGKFSARRNFLRKSFNFTHLTLKAAKEVEYHSISNDWIGHFTYFSRKGRQNWLIFDRILMKNFENWILGEKKNYFDFLWDFLNVLMKFLEILDFFWIFV